MAVEKLDNGTYSVGGKTFPTAEEAFAYDGLKAEGPQGEAAKAPAAAAERHGWQWTRMSTSSRIGAVAAFALLVLFLWGVAKVLLMESEPARAARIQAEATAFDATLAEARAAAERQRQAAAEKCSTEADAIIADARKRLAEGNDYMAAELLSPCKGIVTSESFTALAAKVEAARTARAERLLREEQERKKQQGVAIGMSKQQVLDSSWGKPRSINTTTTAGGTREQWVYGDGNYLYFTNNVLTSIQNSR
ncbi:MAG: hypothetical protein J7605_02765 [Variovorax sp.]|nr:hypothetical protein [Variovorax sp.]